MHLKDQLTNELFEPERAVTAGEILFFRLFEFFIVAYVIEWSWKWGLYMPRNSDVVLPLGIANYVHIRFMFHHSVALISAGLMTVLVLASFFRYGARWLYPLAMILFHFQYAGRYSQGEIPHSANLIGLSLLCFGVGFMLFDERVKRSRFILGCIIFFTGLGYTSAAFTKMIGTGINWADGNHLWLWLAEKKTDILSRTGSFHYNWLQRWALSSRAAATLILAVGWLTELCGFLLWWKKLRPYIISAIIIMHLGITLTMNIRFDAFIYELILIGYPWEKWIDHLILYIPDRYNIKKRLPHTS